MLDTPLVDDTTLRCEALSDRVAALPIGPNAHTLKVALAECDMLERAVDTPLGLCKVRDARHWLRLAFGTTLHGYPPERLRAILLKALAEIGTTAR